MLCYYFNNNNVPIMIKQNNNIFLINLNEVKLYFSEELGILNVYFAKKFH